MQYKLCIINKNWNMDNIDFLEFVWLSNRLNKDLAESGNNSLINMILSGK
jgi:hypothetical protein